MSDLLNTKPLDEIIVGRVEPRIYAFLTTSVPRYLKVGDTYRPVPVRIAEWQRHFKIDDKHDVWDWPAVLSGNVFFRDYSVHQFLLNSKGLVRLDRKALDAIRKGKNLYFSNEFFLDAKVSHVEEALKDIQEDHGKSTGKYSFYSVEAIGKDQDDEPGQEPVDLILRPNQEDAINRFKEAVDEGRTNLLMYAVMRFGKTVAALKCALEMKAEFVVVVSGKADVAREWKNTVLGFNDFKDTYVFLCRKDLEAKYTRVTEELNAGHGVVLFATLQDLQGDAVKPRHKQIFANTIDLLIVDETHFAARADEYGRALRVPKKYSNADASEETSEADASEAVKALNAKVRLHLSGTPYKILMGSEFQPKDIVSFCQFTDIIKEQRQWDAEHLFKNKVDKDGNEIKDESGQPIPYEEWDNPYYGFPQMVRFAFNLNESARKKLEELEAAGVTSKLGELFRPMSMELDTSAKKLHRKFVHEKEVVDLLRAIGGASDEPGILPFLKYEKIEQGQMCHHIVCVLPYCASCDALEALLDGRNRKYKGTFGKLGEYKVINISGKEVKNGFVKIADVVRTISECESKGIKTITLTVNRMLTGSTVPEWDTMLFLKDTSAPQEYDQAIFRLQSSFIRPMTDKQGRKIKFNMKPQTLLVDFDPDRMFRLQEARAQYYNLNTEKNGNRELENRVVRELEVSPIILFNKDKIHRVQASDVMAAISQYSSTRGVAEEVEEIPVDRSIHDDPTLGKFIDGLPELGSKEGLTIAPHTGDETDADTGTAEAGAGENEGNSDGSESADSATGDSEEQKKRDRRIKTLHSLIVFYSFLVPERVHSLDEIIQMIDKTENNKRIARHLGLWKGLLERYRNKVGWQTLQKLDYKIQNLDRLANETQNIDIGKEYNGTPEVVKKAIVAMRKFGRLGEAKIVTPPNIAYDMVKQIPAAELKNLIESGEKILDPASKMGEFAIAIVRRCAEPDINLKPEAFKDAILAIPMCGVTYEFTRKVYELLGLDVKCIAQPENMTSYDLLKVKKADGKSLDYERIKSLLTQNKNFNTIKIGDDVAEGEQTMCKKIGLMISNPPYQELDGGAQVSAIPIYPMYVGVGSETSERYSSFIMPARWYAGGKGIDEFRDDMLNDEHIAEFHDFPMTDDCFPGVNIRGGLCFYLRDSRHDGKTTATKYYSHLDSKHPTVSERNLKVRDSNIMIRYDQGVAILEKIFSSESVESMIAHVSAAKAFGLRTFFINDERFHSGKSGLLHPIKCYGRGGSVGYVEKCDVPAHEDWIPRWKVYIPEANNIGTELNDDNQNAIVGGPGTICTETYLVVGAELNLTRESSKSLANYLKTRFARFLVSLAKSSQHGTSKTFRFVPLQDFTSSSDIDWSRPVSEIDNQLYAKYGLTEAEQKFIESMIKPME